MSIETTVLLLALLCPFIATYLLFFLEVRVYKNRKDTVTLMFINNTLIN